MRKFGVVLGVFLSLASYAFKAQAAADAITLKWTVHVDGKPGDLANCIVDFGAIGDEAFGVAGVITLGVDADKRIAMTISLGALRYDLTAGKQVEVFIGRGWIRVGDFSTEDARYDYVCSGSESMQFRCLVFQSARVIEALWSAVLAGEFVREEARGDSWLQRNWRPLTMLTFVVLVV
ncbi:MAG TPA: hypothetical protein VLG66_10250, partial [Alphaproteobacteria bacterium]|nr:hypothetical protein [Alphaproteobacteria bacterium]